MCWGDDRTEVYVCPGLDGEPGLDDTRRESEHKDINENEECEAEQEGGYNERHSDEVHDIWLCRWGEDGWGRERKVASNGCPLLQLTRDHEGDHLIATFMLGFKVWVVHPWSSTFAQVVFVLKAQLDYLMCIAALLYVIQTSEQTHVGNTNFRAYIFR